MIQKIIAESDAAGRFPVSMDDQPQVSVREAYLPHAQGSPADKLVRYPMTMQFVIATCDYSGLGFAVRIQDEGHDVILATNPAEDLALLAVLGADL